LSNLPNRCINKRGKLLIELLTMVTQRYITEMSYASQTINTERLLYDQGE